MKAKMCWNEETPLASVVRFTLILHKFNPFMVAEVTSLGISKIPVLPAGNAASSVPENKIPSLAVYSPVPPASIHVSSPSSENAPFSIF